MSDPDVPASEAGAGYKVRGPETWTSARADYEGGLSGPEVCERYDLGLSALRTRARAEGWRRRDLPDPDPLAEDEADGVDELPDLTPAQAAAAAWTRASRALRRGRLHEAERWTRLHRTLSLAARAAVEAQAAAVKTEQARAAALEEATRRRRDAEIQAEAALRSARTGQAPGLAVFEIMREAELARAASLLHRPHPRVDRFAVDRDALIAAGEGARPPEPARGAALHDVHDLHAPEPPAPAADAGPAPDP